MSRLIAARMSEVELQEHIRQLCDDLGLAIQHYEESRRCWLHGWPDLEIIGNRIIYRELKTEWATLRPNQRLVGSKIIRAGGNWAVWRPRDLVAGIVSRQLGEIALAKRTIGNQKD